MHFSQKPASLSLRRTQRNRIVIINNLALGTLVLANISWNLLDPKPDVNSLTATEQRIKACLIDDTYTGKLTTLGLEVVVSKTELSVKNVTNRPINFEINRGLSQYTLSPDKSLNLVNIRNQTNCIVIQPN